MPRSTRCAARAATSCHCSRTWCEFFRPTGGFTLTTDSEAPAGAGIGGSSAMAVAICAALDRLTGAGLRREDWIHISRDVEAIVIRVPTGTQDHYPPAFGGAAAIVLAPGRRAARSPRLRSRRTRAPARPVLHGKTAATWHQQLGSVQAAHRWRPARFAKSGKNFDRRASRCAPRSSETSGTKLAAWCAKNGNSAAAIFARFRLR